MEARAVHRYIPTSPRKMKLVIDLIRGKGVEEALSILHFSSKHSSKEAEKTLRSAIANLQNNNDAGRVDFSDLFVKEVYVNQGPTIKRMLPAPMGRAYRVRKRSNHLIIVVAMRKDAVKAKKEKEKKEIKAKTAKPAKSVKPAASKAKEAKEVKTKKASPKKSTTKKESKPKTTQRTAKKKSEDKE